MEHKFTNGLINENSPYLLQHAHNPVDWFAWGDEALSKARAEDKVILVSIGYSACHWCHVMERESFENESVAKIMNDNFINIKIDREERPDLDHIYMDAVQAISGSGGWPLNVFLTPETKPFFGGTYFPPVQAFNRSSWTDVLQGIAQAWQDRKNELLSQADNVMAHLEQGNGFAQIKNKLPAGVDNVSFTINDGEAMFTAIMKTADTVWGGFGQAPKFPQTFTIGYLFQYHYFTGNTIALKQALLSVDKMLEGGIYDHVSGGLARYSTDAEWLAPHFEKMLYDNALLINTLCDAYQLTTQKKYEAAIRKTISFIINELSARQGGFYAALDADSEGEEGKYYVWQKAEVDKILGEDAQLFCTFFDISAEGNWEGKNILRTLTRMDDFVAENQLHADQFSDMINQGLEKLRQVRNERVRPALDDKIILGWNALMIKSLARAAVVLQDKPYRDLAVKNFDFLIDNFKKESSSPELLHTYKNGTAKYPAFLDDYAYLVAAAIHLYRATFNENYLWAAEEYCSYVVQNFSDQDNVFFYFTHQAQNDIIVRKKEIYDGATPSGNSVMAENLYQLAIIFDARDWKERVDKMMQYIAVSVVKYPGSFGIWAGVLLQQIAGTSEIVITGTDFEEVSNKIFLNYLPNIVMMSSSKENNKFPLLMNKPFNESVRIYLCKNYACLAPFSDTNSLIKEINNINKLTI